MAKKDPSLATIKAVFSMVGCWGNMVARCGRESHPKYESYGGRGISVCDAWLGYPDGAARFAQWAINNGYKSKLVLDRIDVNGNYEPENCRFVTHQISLRNLRATLYITAFGETKHTYDWADDLRTHKSITAHVLKGRIIAGWDVKRAFTQPARPRKKNAKRKKR